ncbi:MAG: LTA synthase family protein, partial [Methylococcales bacterium]
MMRRLKFLPLLLLFIPVVLKGLFIDDFIYHYTGARYLGLRQVLVNDAGIYCAVLLLLYVSFLTGVSRLAAAGLRLCACLVLTVYCIDYFIIVNFNTRLAMGDVSKYTGYAWRYIQQIYHLNDVSLGLLVAVAVIPVIVFAGSRRFAVSGRFRRLPIPVLMVLPVAAGVTDQQQYAHAWLYQNVLDYNLTIRSESAAYSPAFLSAFKQADAPQCAAGLVSQKNIIILMVESLSAYQSLYFSGLNNWTPNLDTIARSHHAFKNFYANGFITEDGEIALLTGLQPVYPPASYADEGGTSFYSFYDIKESLPRILHKHGYKTEFLTTADLDFGNTGNWAKSIGFDYIEGHNHPDYDKWERFHFQAAPDAALYQRMLSRIREHQGQRFFMFSKTVSSHHPYVNPENKQQSEAEAISYTDKQIGLFYQQLLATGFFKDGLLFIVGDHHSMTPLKKAELDLYGQFKASAKVPLVIVGDVQGAVTETRQFQQIDVFNSLKGMQTGQFCHTDWTGLFWADHKVSPRYVVHRRGDNRTLVSVFTESAEYLLKLDGDRTRLIGNPAVDKAEQQSLLDKINALRIT